MKKINFLISVFGVLLLTGCQNKEKEVVGSENSNNEVTNITENKSEVSKKTIWTDKKNQELITFVATWGNKMEQEYKFYDESDKLIWNNQEISKKEIDKLSKINVDKQSIPLKLFSSNQEDFNVVAIASDEEDSDLNNHHVYFFVLEKDEPKVLVLSEESTDKKIIASESKNEELKQGFVNIVKEKAVVTKEEPFDSLEDRIKAVLLTEAFDERLATDFEFLSYPGRMYLSYFEEGADFYFQLTSGAGVGHPIYVVNTDKKDVTFNQGIIRISSEDYEMYEGYQSSVSKEELYTKYEKNREKYEEAVDNFDVQYDENLKEVFQRLSKLLGNSSSEVENNNSSLEVPTAEEIFGYYRDYIIDYGDMFDTESLRQRVAMKGIDERGYPIISHVVHGSEIDIDIKDNTIYYAVYAMGGASEDGVVAKSHLFNAYYNYETQEHGKL